jgi:L-threonylcarbamoyladenylate synthase
MRNLSPDQAAEVIHEGGVIAYPTEAVWGLGCDPFDEAAVMRLLAIKQRDVAKGLILVAARRAQFDGLLDWSTLPSDRIAAVDASWPGPHTTGVAARVSDHPLVIALCERFGAPLVSTSANLAGEPPAFSRDALDPRLLARLDGVTEGETGGLSAPTAIRDALTGSVLRL